jgi:hypothetical protein
MIDAASTAAYAEVIAIGTADHNDIRIYDRAVTP